MNVKYCHHCKITHKNVPWTNQY